MHSRSTHGPSMPQNNRYWPYKEILPIKPVTQISANQQPPQPNSFIIIQSDLKAPNRESKQFVFTTKQLLMLL